MDVFPYCSRYLVFGLEKTRTSHQGGSLPFWSNEAKALNDLGQHIILIGRWNKNESIGIQRVL